MTNRSTAQSWALDAAIAQGGFDALHPQARGITEAFGVDHTDYDEVFGQTCRWPATPISGLPPAELAVAWRHTEGRDSLHHLRDQSGIGQSHMVNN
jgi:hypothetical protein